jgi:hypothetical protein
VVDQTSDAAREMPEVQGLAELTALLRKHASYVEHKYQCSKLLPGSLRRAADAITTLSAQLAEARADVERWQATAREEAARGNELKAERDGLKLECEALTRLVNDFDTSTRTERDAATARAEAAEGHVLALLDATKNHEAHIGAGEQCPLCRARKSARSLTQQKASGDA